VGIPGEQPFDLVSMIAEKNPRLAAALPPILRRLIELVAHQREVRRFIGATAGCDGCEFVRRALVELGITTTLHNRERLPRDPRFVMCANHPTGGIDGLVLMNLLCETYGGVRVPANDLVLALPALETLVVPVDKYGSNAGRVEEYAAAFRAPLPVLVFPAGRTARMRGGVLRDFPWTKTFLRQARRSGRSIVPVHLSGRNSAHFYLIWKLRRALRIAPNLEMFLLVDELARLRGRSVTVTIGSPRRPEPTATPGEDRATAEKLRRTVARLASTGNRR
jgi:putative hemolysin